MIKFNFNANVNIKNNGTQLDKKGLKTILIIFGVFMLVFAFSAIAFSSFAFGSMESMQERVDEYNKQVDVIHSLPVLKCTVYTDQTISAPLSGKDAAFYLLRVGTVKQNKRYKEIYEKFDYAMAAGYPKGAQLLINGQLYPIDFNRCIIKNPDQRNMPFVYETYTTSDRTPYYLQDYKPRGTQKISLLKNLHPWIQSFFEPSGLNNLLVNEYIFKNGDSVYIKGKIENNRIVPFVEHMVN
ncbi:hypothetical protein KYG33_00225 [Chryseobacterium sp. D764]|jgi:hypothetical protein|uniref:hypothetical protein n=1 Tax=unclassified Chryseobacterium TaxID=2593645 RepID=UPI000986E2BB|nr:MULTISPECIES: hypothetical protein [unclassified Chryseobacterium]QXU49509.1 hypothetical protein KYG33_00225 [Chryseobacterium sp. D764]CAD0225295.1 conserved protein of unknown function [Chryseobacterium sp. JV274]